MNVQLPLGNHTEARPRSVLDRVEHRVLLVADGVPAALQEAVVGGRL